MLDYSQFYVSYENKEMVMNRTTIFFAFALSCIFSSNFFAAEKKMELTTLTKIKPIFLDKGLTTQVPDIKIKFERVSGWIGYKTVIKDIFVGEKKSLMALLYSDNVDGYSFCPLLLYINESGKRFSTLFTSVERHQDMMDACRYNQAIFYPYKRGVILFRLDRSIEPDFFEKEENWVKKLVDEDLKRFEQ